MKKKKLNLEISKKIILKPVISHYILILLYILCIVLLFGIRMNLIHFSGHVSNLDDQAIYVTPANLKDLHDSTKPNFKHTVQTITIDPVKGNHHPHFYNLTYTQGLFNIHAKMKPLNFVESHLHTTGLTKYAKVAETVPADWQNDNLITELNFDLNLLQYQIDYESTPYYGYPLAIRDSEEDDLYGKNTLVDEPDWNDTASNMHRKYIQLETGRKGLTYEQLLMHKVTLPAYNNQNILSVKVYPYMHTYGDMHDSLHSHLYLPKLTALNHGKWHTTIQFYDNYLSTRVHSPIQPSDVVYYQGHYYFQTVINGLYVKDSNISAINGKPLDNFLKLHPRHILNLSKKKLSVQYRIQDQSLIDTLRNLTPYNINSISENSVFNNYNNVQDPLITYIP